MDIGNLKLWTPPPAPPAPPATTRCLAWPRCPLSPLATPPRMIDAERCTPGGVVKVETYSAAGGRWTEAYYVPTAADLAALDRLEPGCPPDRVPWERFRAELIAAPAGLLPERDWQRAPAASLLMMLEALRRRMADDEAASRGIGEPEAPREPETPREPKTPRRTEIAPGERGTVSQGDKARLLLLRCFESGKPCPKLADLVTEGGVSAATLSKEAKALKRHNPRFAEWYQPRQCKARVVGNVTEQLLAVTEARPDEPAIPIEDVQAFRDRIMADPRVQHLRDELTKWSGDQWAAVANWGTDKVEGWLVGQAAECRDETCTRMEPADDGSGRLVRKAFTRPRPRVRPG